MRRAHVKIMQGGKSYSLSPGMNNFVLKEGAALLSVAGSSARLFFNDVELDLQDVEEKIRIGGLDLQNRPGLHRLKFQTHVGNIDYDFATSTAKATWAEIEAMVAATRLYALGPGRPFLYLGADGLQRADSIEQLIFWLRDRLHELSQLSTSIDKAPAARMQPRLRTSSRTRGLDLRATAALLRERPALLEETSSGGIALGAKKYWPALVRVRSTEASIPQSEHRQLRTLLRRALSACRSVAPILPEASGFIPELIDLLRLRTLGSHLAGAGDAYPLALESAVERRDPRYRRLRQLEHEYELNFSHLENVAVSIRAGLRDVWEIYQAFVAHTIGRALELGYVSDRGDLRVRDEHGASMIGHGLRLFYDAQVPGVYLPSWRSASVRPAFERPDIVVVNEAEKRAIVLDVKFSVGDDGQCRSTHLFEMQGYLNSYGLQTIGVVFPGQSSAMRDISDGSFTIAEIPLRADALLKASEAGLVTLRDRLDGLWNSYGG